MDPSFLHGSDNGSGTWHYPGGLGVIRVLPGSRGKVAVWLLRGCAHSRPWERSTLNGFRLCHFSLSFCRYLKSQTISLTLFCSVPFLKVAKLYFQNNKLKFWGEPPKKSFSWCCVFLIWWYFIFVLIELNM